MARENLKIYRDFIVFYNENVFRSIYFTLSGYLLFPGRIMLCKNNLTQLPIHDNIALFKHRSDVYFHKFSATLTEDSNTYRGHVAGYTI